MALVDNNMVCRSRQVTHATEIKPSTPMQCWSPRPYGLSTEKFHSCH